MSTLGNPDNIKIERVSLKWFNHKTQKAQAVANPANALDGTYFNLPSGNVEWYVWFNGGGLDPAPGGAPIGVVVSGDETAAQVAALVATAIDAEADFNAKVDACDPDCVIIMDATSSTVADATDNDSGFTFTTILEGEALDIGFTDDFEMPAGGLELVDVSALQNGTTVIQRLRSGRNLEAISVPMKESDAAKIQEFIAANGDTYTPAGGTEVYGLGTSKLGDGVLADSRRISIHPVRLDDNDTSEDYLFWRAFPALGNIAFSAESEEIINVEFSLLPDPLMADEVKHMVFGDWTQNLLK